MITPAVTALPTAATEFAQEILRLAEKYDLRDIDMQIRFRLTEQTVKVRVSKIDGRGRPRTQAVISAETVVEHVIVWEPNTSN